MEHQMKRAVEDKVTELQVEAATTQRKKALLRLIKDLKQKMDDLERSQTVADPIETPLAIYRYTLEKLEGIVEDES